MARVKVVLPESLPFECRIPVRVTDLNYGGHVGNDVILSYVQEARVQFLAQFGWTELNVAGAGIIMADAAIEYKAECFYGMILRISVGAGDIGSRGFTLYYQICNDFDNQEIARVQTGIVFFDYENRKVLSVPGDFIKQIHNFDSFPGLPNGS
jgi:acyl-CoA thioesterase FadM